MKAMILAAGFGTRLWPLTIGRTKPALPFLNRPLISYTIEYLKKYGCTDFIINLHHEPDSVRDQIGDGAEYGVNIAYSIEEPEILGTSGALDNVRHLLSDETFIVINGKIITDIDLKEALETHKKQNALVTMVLVPNPEREHFREVLVSSDGKIEGFGKFPSETDSVNPLRFTGIHIMEPEIFDYIPRGIFSDSVKDVYPKAIAEGRTIAAHISNNSWFELSTLDRYLEISLEFLNRENKDWIADEGTRLGFNAIVESSVLWKNVQVESGAHLSQCIVADNVTIPSGSYFYKSVIFPASEAEFVDKPEKALPNDIIGENLVVYFGEE